MTVIQFPEKKTEEDPFQGYDAKDVVCICECGCKTHYLHPDGTASCAGCDAEVAGHVMARKDFTLHSPNGREHSVLPPSVVAHNMAFHRGSRGTSFIFDEDVPVSILLDLKKLVEDLIAERAV